MTPNLSERSISTLTGAGPKTAARLATVGITTVCDLLHCLPVRFQDRTRVVPLGHLEPESEAYFSGEVLNSTVRYGRRRSLWVTVADATGILNLRFFHFSEGQRRSFSVGVRLAGFGVVKAGREGLEVVHPEYQLLSDGARVPREDNLTPVYPAPDGIGQATMRKLIAGALAALANGGIVTDTLPSDIRERFGLVGLGAALRQAHQPDPDTAHSVLQAVERRLALDEFLAHHISLRQLRGKLLSQHAPRMAKRGSISNKFLADLPFALTKAQSRVAREIWVDLARSRPMYRLLQGDVGSGKTVIAALAALRCVENGHQCAFMAPTELLAEQHHATLRTWFEPLGLKVGYLAGKMKAKERRETLAGIASGALSIVVGTHALVQEAVAFGNLGLAIIDEQHRFGVDQRLRLTEALTLVAADDEQPKSKRPHLLLMTATPIPRTLSMVAFADLDTSVLHEMPPGRTPVSTAVIADARREEIIERTAEACRAGQQAYWICPLVEESEELSCRAATQTAADLAVALPDLRIGLVHGRLSAAEKEVAMTAFKDGQIDWLVATTVVEVGVDVPNASVMVIENAERLGLSQLHQLRGRVGRGQRKSACVLIYSAPLSQRAAHRLEALRSTNDGFVIAQRDLELRGPGEILGVRQAGHADYRYADLCRDAALLPTVERIASVLLDEAPQAAQTLVDRWVGNAASYAHA